MLIVEWKIATATEWDEAWSDSPHATYFHSREWHELFMHYMGGSAVAIKVRFDDGVSVVLPMSSRFPGLLSRIGIRIGRREIHESSPAGTIGGWIPHAGLRVEHAKALVDRLLTSKGLIWRLNPYDPLAPHLLRMLDKAVEHDTTHALELTPENSQTMRGWSKGHQRSVHKARSMGVSVRIATSTQDWQAYYRCYLDSLDRWGSAARTRYRYRLFELLAASRNKDVKLWVAEIEGEVVAGAICLYSREHVAYWHGAALRTALFARPTHAIHYQAMMHAAGSGYRWYDFNPSAGLEGVRRFKRGFGAREMPAGIVRT